MIQKHRELLKILSTLMELYKDAKSFDSPVDMEGESNTFGKIYFRPVRGEDGYDEIITYTIYHSHKKPLGRYYWDDETQSCKHMYFVDEKLVA